MPFLHPMWDHESQRIGLSKCTPRGYAIRGWGEVVGFAGLLLLLATPVVWCVRAVRGADRSDLVWWAAAAFALGVVSEAMVWLGWSLAARRGWKYDWDDCRASWLKDGTRVSFKYGEPQTFAAPDQVRPPGGLGGAAAAGSMRTHSDDPPSP